jgi:hypothetical protein
MGRGHPCGPGCFFSQELFQRIFESHHERDLYRHTRPRLLLPKGIRRFFREKLEGFLLFTQADRSCFAHHLSRHGPLQSFLPIDSRADALWAFKRLETRAALSSRKIVCPPFDHFHQSSFTRGISGGIFLSRISLASISAGVSRSIHLPGGLHGEGVFLDGVSLRLIPQPYRRPMVAFRHLLSRPRLRLAPREVGVPNFPDPLSRPFQHVLGVGGIALLVIGSKSPQEGGSGYRWRKGVEECKRQVFRSNLKCCFRNSLFFGPLSASFTREANT